MVDYNRDIQEAVAEADTSAIAPSNVITFKNGVQLKKKNFKILIVQEVISKFKYPDPPEYWDAERNRGIKNPDHPEYIRQKEEIDVARGLAAVDALIAFGTELVYCPPEVEALESENWIDDLALLDIIVKAEHRKARYLSWIKFVAITDDSDVEQLISLIKTSAGTPGEKVAKAIDSFPGH